MVIGAAGELPKPPYTPIVFLEGKLCIRCSQRRRGQARHLGPTWMLGLLLELQCQMDECSLGFKFACARLVTPRV